MGMVMTVPCRSYPALTFDGCPACVGAALEAAEQAGIYVLGRTAPGLASQTAGPLEMAYRMKVRLFDETGEELAADELEAEQTIEAVRPDDESVEEVVDTADEDEDGGTGGDGEDHSTMRLDDFQTVLDRLELAPAGPRGLSGIIAGRLFGFERSIGEFEIEVAPGH